MNSLLRRRTLPCYSLPAIAPWGPKTKRLQALSGKCQPCRSSANSVCGAPRRTCCPQVLAPPSGFCLTAAPKAVLQGHRWSNRGKKTACRRIRLRRFVHMRAIRLCCVRGCGCSKAEVVRGCSNVAQDEMRGGKKCAESAPVARVVVIKKHNMHGGHRTVCPKMGRRQGPQGRHRRASSRRCRHRKPRRPLRLLRKAGRRCCRGLHLCGHWSAAKEP